MLTKLPHRDISHRQFNPIWALLLIIVIVAIGLAVAPINRADAHPELVRSSPPADGLLAAPPQKIDLWMSERVDTGGGSPALKVLDSNGVGLPVTNLHVDSQDQRHIEAGVTGVGAGTYTVVWTARSADDGHTLTGSFAFRVGTGSAPGAATVEGQTPQAWAVATRWLTFLGIAIAIASFLYRIALLAGVTGNLTAARRRAFAGLIGGIVATVATAAEPLLQTWFPPTGAITPTFRDALNGMPNAWWLRLVASAVVVIIGVVLVSMQRGARRTPSTVLELGGAAVGLAALLGLSLTGHAAARETWRALAIASDTIHQWSVALWVGGLIQLGISWIPGRVEMADSDQPSVSPIRRFSRYALFLVLIGGAAGVLNAGLILPALHDLWSSDYGRIIIAKTAVLLPVLLLATFHRRKIHQTAQRFGVAILSTVRLEAALVIFVVLGGSILALMAPPVKAAVGSAQQLDLAGPTTGGNPDQPLQLRLQIKPAKPGENQIHVIVENDQAKPVPAATIALVRLDFESLSHQTEQPNIEAKPDAQGNFSINGNQLSLDGWWRVTTTVRQLGVPDATGSFYFVLPDPNVNGFDAPKIPSTNSEAEALFNRALKDLTATKQVRYTQELGGGTGTFIESDHLVDVGGAEPATELVAADFRQITIGATQWIKQTGQDWIQRPASPVIPPSEWGGDYEGATAFQFGVKESINGVETQMVSFYVPPKGLRAAAWFSWWVDPATGHIMRETMVSRSHYMVNTFTSYGKPLGIKPPTAGIEATPAATPTG
ncbi:MAG TPA: copper resistance protein CopC [Thermomicrobiales bacterium]|nr:copper resistance protein CopC [Thermomicrobiales bacterium]